MQNNEQPSTGPAQTPPTGPAAMPPARNANEPGQEAPVEQGGDQPTQQEQDHYDRVVLASMKILYSDQTHQGVMNMLKSGGQPDEAIANTVSMILLELDKKSGGKIPQEVILPAAAELVQLAAELGDKAGVFKTDERTMALAMQRTIAKVGEKYGIDPADVQALLSSIPKEEVQSIVQKQQGYQQNSPAQAAGQAPATPPAQPGAEA